MRPDVFVETALWFPPSAGWPPLTRVSSPWKIGGRADMAQAGGNDPAALPVALEAVPAWVRQRLIG